MKNFVKQIFIIALIFLFSISLVSPAFASSNLVGLSITAQPVGTQNIFWGNLSGGSTGKFLTFTNGTDVFVVDKDGNVTAAGTIQIKGGTPGAGKVLTSDANGLASWQAGGGSSQWTTSGSNIYYTGNIGIGTSNVSNWHASFTGINIGSNSAIMAEKSGTGDLRLLSNTYYDGTYKYITNGYATGVWLDSTAGGNSGGFDVETASNGSANGAISWTDVFHVGNNGNVGIGAGSPNNKLQIGLVSSYSGNSLAMGNGTQQFAIDISAVTIPTFYSNNNFSFMGSGGGNGNVGIGLTNPSAALHVKGSNSVVGIKLFGGGNSGVNILQVGATDGSPLMVMDDNGRIGIGTTNPKTKLEVYGSSVASPVNTGTTPNSVFQIHTSSNVTLDVGSLTASPYSMWMQTDDVTGYQWHYPLALNPLGGNVGVGTTDPTGQMSGTQGIGIYSSTYPAIGFKNSTANWLWYADGSTFKMWNSSVGDMLTANTSGNVGIGNSSPNTKLLVSGDQSIYGGTINSANDATLYVTANNDNDWGLIVNKNIGGSSNYGIDSIVGNSATYGLLVTGGSTERFRVTGSGEAYLNGGWYRTYGNAGWYSQDYGGGIYMQDSSWVRTYGSKNFYVDQQIRAARSVNANNLDEAYSGAGGMNANYYHSATNDSWFSYPGNNYNYIRGNTYIGNDTGIIKTSGGLGVGTTAVCDVCTKMQVEAGSAADAITANGNLYGIQASANSAGGAGVYSTNSNGSGYDFYGNGPKSYFRGNVGVGVSSPLSALHVEGSQVRWTYTDQDVGLLIHDHNSGSEIMAGHATDLSSAVTLYLNTSYGGDVYVGTGNFYVGNNAYKPSGGSWSASSDQRVKKDIVNLDGKTALDKLTSLQAKEYKWINPDAHSNDTGVHTAIMAQDLQKVFPTWVSKTDPVGADKNLIPSGDQVLNVSYPNDFNAYLIAALKELKQENQDKQAQLDVQQKEIDALKQMLKR